jgi:hypothetical protein
MTMEDGRIVSLSFRDWLGLIGLVASVLIVVFTLFTGLIRMMERIDTTMGHHAQRLDRIEARLDKDTKQ